MSATRSDVMRAVRSKNTIPEMVVRRLIHGLGYRYRLHRPDLPGRPDLVFSGRRKIIFVHGCWWHGHHCRRGAREPATRRDYWIPKVARNRKRDAAAMAGLEADGWRILVVWECEIKDIDALCGSVSAFLEEAYQAPPRA